MEIEITPMSPDSEGVELAKEFAKERKYPEDYKGPKAGKSEQNEWVSVRDYDAFCYLRDGTWTYSDFDCYLYAMCEEHYKKGEKKIRDLNNECLVDEAKAIEEHKLKKQQDNDQIVMSSGYL